MRELLSWARERWIALGVLVMLLAALQVAAGGQLGAGLAVRQSPCSGLLPREEFGALIGDAEVSGQRIRNGDGLDRVQCSIMTPDGRRDLVALRVRAVTTADDVDHGLRELLRQSAMREWRDPLPEGLPGMLIEQRGRELRVALLLPCSDLPREVADRERQLLVTVDTYVSEDANALLRSAVHAANSSSASIGCGTPPLPPPTGNLERNPEEGTPIAAARTACEAVVPALPEDAPEGGWRTYEAATDSGPYSLCEIPLPGGSIWLEGLFGPWSESVRAARSWFSSEEEQRPLSEQWQPWANTAQGFAVSECQGEPAVFMVAKDYSVDYDITDEEIRALLATFATDQAARRGCGTPELP
ncbi:hypothetical protein ACWGIB_23715 [Streptomyces xiamenensis]